LINGVPEQQARRLFLNKDFSGPDMEGADDLGFIRRRKMPAGNPVPGSSAGYPGGDSNGG
jgi:hypothetical protein